MEEAFHTVRLTPEQEFVIRLLSDHLYGMKTSAPDETVDWYSLASIAKSHEISGILYRQCREYVPKELKEELERKFGFTLFQYAKRQEEEKRIDSALNEKSISHFFIKGSAVAAFYPVPALRTMGDSDLVIQGENREAVDVILKQLGFICISKDNYQKQALKLEVHDHLVHAGSIVSCEMAEFFNTVWNYVEDGKLDWSFHFLFLLVHLRSHFAGSGVGLRQFMDLAVIMKNDPGLDWRWIQERLTEFNLLPFAKNVFALNEKWFSENPRLILLIFRILSWMKRLNLSSGTAFSARKMRKTERVIWQGIMRTPVFRSSICFVTPGEKFLTRIGI